jgi:transcription elongation factor GreA
MRRRRASNFREVAAMATEKVPMTLAGYDRLADEMKRLKSIERPAIIKAIAEARGHGDLSENAEYHAAREKQSFIEGRLAEIEDKLSRAEVIDVTKLSGDTVRFGAIVTLVDEDTDQESTYQIVGVDEADLEKGLISVVSPLARALIGKAEGENVEVAAPSGPKAYEILKVRFG